MTDVPKTTMVLCESCRFSEPAKHGINRLSCLRWKRGYHEDWSALAPDDCLVENDEGWAMIVGPKFGCVLGEPRDD